MLYEFLALNREELIARCKLKVAKRYTPPVTEKELEFGIPVFLTQLTDILRAESFDEFEDGLALPEKNAASAVTIIGSTASRHGHELLEKGFTVDQVVHDYGDLCQAVTELAVERNVPIKTDEFKILNRCLDDAIADAVSNFTQQRDRVVAESSEQTMNERLGVIAHEFRNRISTAMLALSFIQSGNVGINGSTGAVLERSLKALQELCDRALVDVRLKAGIPERRERVLVRDFVYETEMCAAVDAKARNIGLVVSEVEPGLVIEVDRQILSGVVVNLLQNAFKFTRPQGRVSLKAFSLADRILIEVEDECGGLPLGNTEDLFQMFERRSANRSGLGIGLGLSRRGVEANGGQLHVDNLPGKGCVFTIDLPKASTSSP